MRKLMVLSLLLASLLAFAGCSGTSQEDAAGTIKFYSEATKEFTDPVSAASIELSKEQIKEIQSTIDGVEDWVDDDLANRKSAYYFDGEIGLTNAEFVYYFTYEYNIIYCGHYFAEISTEDMQYIKDISVDR